MNNEVLCFKCNGKGYVAKICPNNFKKNKKWCNNCKSQTLVRESCRYKKRDTIKAAVEGSSFVFKINDRPQRTVESKRIMVDTGATSHIIRDIARFKNFDDSFQPDNHFIELTDWGRFKTRRLWDMPGECKCKYWVSHLKRGIIYTLLPIGYIFCQVSHGKHLRKTRMSWFIKIEQNFIYSSTTGYII